MDARGSAPLAERTPSTGVIWRSVAKPGPVGSSWSTGPVVLIGAMALTAAVGTAGWSEATGLVPPAASVALALFAGAAISIPVLVRGLRAVDACLDRKRFLPRYTLYERHGIVSGEVSRGGRYLTFRVVGDPLVDGSAIDWGVVEVVESNGRRGLHRLRWRDVPDPEAVAAIVRRARSA